MKEQEFLNLCAPVAELVGTKDLDYNTGIALASYFPFGDKSYIHMLHTKVQRLISLENKASQGGKPTFESRLDSVQDLLAYTVFYLDYLEKELDNASL